MTMSGFFTAKAQRTQRTQRKDKTCLLFLASFVSFAPLR